MKVVVVNSLSEAEILRIAHATSATPVTMTHMADRPDAIGCCERFEVVGASDWSGSWWCRSKHTEKAKIGRAHV